MSAPLSCVMVGRLHVELPQCVNSTGEIINRIPVSVGRVACPAYPNDYLAVLLLTNIEYLFHFVFIIIVYLWL